MVLCGEPFKPLGAPQPNTLNSVPIIPKDAKDPHAYEHRKAEVKLALNTLGSFDFSGHVLNEFVRDVAIKYVEDEDPEIREAAALTCCQLYVRDPIVNQTSYHALQVVGDVIEKLLTVGVSDPEPNIRRTVLAALDERFDRHLAKAENIRILFFALNDEVFSIREVAISIIGRLARYNPAYVIPSLRKTLIQMLTELEFSDVARNKEESAKLLSLLVQNAQSLIKPYVEPMISVLLPKAKDNNPSVAATILKAIGELATVGGEDMMPYKDKLMPVVLDALQDQSSNIKREAALHALGQLASNSGYVIQPYIEYPQLLEILQSIIRTEGQRVPLRQETIKLMGILGALDPYKHQAEEQTPDSRRGEANQLTDISLMMTGLTPSNKEYFPTVVINALLQILKGFSLVQHHAAVIEAIINIFRTLGLECVSFLDRIIPAFLQLGKDYLHFMGTVNKVINQHQIQHSNYELLVSKLQKGEVLPQDLSSGAGFADGADEPPFADQGTKKLEMNAIHLKAAWDTKGKSTKEDWQEWLRRFSTTLLTESPNHALRACASLASVYLPLARELFNSAFVSCWSELYEQFQDELIQNIESAIKSESVPPDLLGLLLNLAEFMEHNDKALPIDIRVLGKEAACCHAYAKALHYKELEFLQDQSSGAVEALIVINNQLQQSDAAIGILRKAQLYKEGIQLRETWFEKLERWEEALAFYNKREEEVPEDQAIPVDIVMGKMRCLHALGEWEALASLTGSTWANSTPEVQRMIAPLATAAAWGLNKWDSMDNYLSSLKRYSPDRSFFGAILALHRNQFREAIACVQQAREGLDTELSALVSESYNRAYQVVVRVQMLAELEELIVYKQCDEKKQAIMRRTWETRLKGCQRNVEIWQRMLRLRAIVIAPTENMHMWIKFANLCRKSGRMGLAEKSLKQLIGTDAPLVSTIPYWSEQRQPGPGPRNAPAAQVIYAVLKYQWELGQQLPANKKANIPEKTLYCLRKFTNDAAHRLEVAKTHLNAQAGSEVNITGDYGFQNQMDPTLMSPQTQRALYDQTVLLAKCYLRQGEWLIALDKDDWQYTQVQDILTSYSQATKYNPRWYKAWHAWALANFEIVQTLTTGNEGHLPRTDHNMVIDHVVPAVKGFFKSIALSQGSSLQDTLRLLTLWFTHGGSADVNTAVTEGFANVSVDTWLEVIPQLIARINQPNKRVQQSVHNLLADVGRAHPQALVYPLTVAMKSWQNTRRSRSAAQIMDSMRQHSANLVAQADTRHLNIQRYPAIPLSQNSGLLGWFPNSDTLHVLIREYRESRKILLNIEHRIMLQMAPDYDNLTLMQKVEVFGFALDNTTGQDLYRVLWLKSKSSEAWLERRTNYTRSLGVMSMVGYILGLGDRHPSNLKLDRVTGKIIHVDFGDCFEVAMKREKYPERVPFRLTRMFTYAMGVSNIEGSFRITCENVMRVLRDNKESVMAVLEAFIHDPLLTWRLTNAASPTDPNFRSDRDAAMPVPGGVRARRASILDSDVAPSELLNAPEASIQTRARARTNSSAGEAMTNGGAPEVESQNTRAVEVLDRVQQKLTGRDFKNNEELDVIAQVNKLIMEATKLENLCQHYIGWCSFW
ncbi:Serine/threonine-protein kinase tor2 [Fusarium oxysporum]|uniref:non-specific serine/threonine protein kinase n=1 Tax=Fusarium oxysporum TaxID=5507 RepID=A0A420M8D2_FUSOX|nr:Serine/threonine-protein kinase tor2 [Fusarium oxysporum]